MSELTTGAIVANLRVLQKGGGTNVTWIREAADRLDRGWTARPDLRAPDGNSFDPGLRAAVAAAIRRYPVTDAEQWIGPEAVLGEIEKFLSGSYFGKPHP